MNRVILATALSTAALLVGVASAQACSERGSSNCGATVWSERDDYRDGSGYGSTYGRGNGYGDTDGRGYGYKDQESLGANYYRYDDSVTVRSNKRMVDED
jgi:hypothetical protein